MLEKMISRESVSSRGVTLIEVMLVVVILGILAAIALPAFDRLIDGRRIRGATESIFSDLNYVRSQSFKLGTEPASMTFTATGAAWSYEVQDASGTLRSTAAGLFPGTSVDVTPDDGADDDTITLDPKRGSINKAVSVGSIVLIEIESRLGAKTRIMVDPASNLRVCNVIDVGAYPSCS